MPFGALLRPIRCSGDPNIRKRVEAVSVWKRIACSNGTKTYAKL
jgi:hypothetical protein